MTIGPDLAGAVTAFNRFGFGARPDDLKAAAGDPRGFLLEELWTANVALIGDRPPPAAPATLQAYFLEQQQKRAERTKMAMASPKAPSIVLFMAPSSPQGPPVAPMSASQSVASQQGKPDSARPPQVEQALFRAEAVARLQKQLRARVGFVERLVTFWSNHFAVSVAKSAELRVAAGPFEREAIRPNVLALLWQIFQEFGVFGIPATRIA